MLCCPYGSAVQISGPPPSSHTGFSGNCDVHICLPSGKRTNGLLFGKSPFFKGKSTISMAMFNSSFVTPGYVNSSLLNMAQSK